MKRREFLKIICVAIASLVVPKTKNNLRIPENVRGDLIYGNAVPKWDGYVNVDINGTTYQLLASIPEFTENDFEYETEYEYLEDWYD